VDLDTVTVLAQRTFAVVLELMAAAVVDDRRMSVGLPLRFDPDLPRLHHGVLEPTLLMRGRTRHLCDGKVLPPSISVASWRQRR
jgi:hypothetical protein